VVRDEELTLEEVKTSRTLGGSGEFPDPPSVREVGEGSENKVCGGEGVEQCRCSCCLHRKMPTR
jgi:hypothetical protein